MNIRAFGKAVALFVRYYPSFVREMVEAQTARDQSRDAYREGFKRVRQLPLEGPNVHSLPTETVNNIEEYLDRAVHSPYSGDVPRVVYRGQNENYYLSDEKSLSLLPVMARPHHDSLRLPGRKFESAFENYLKKLIGEYIASTTDDSAEAKMMGDLTWDDGSEDARLFGLTAQGKFFRGLYPSSRLPDLFQAALQHYGFPTLTLDVTCSPLVALFFAMHEFNKHRRHEYSCRPTGRGGVVYVIQVNSKPIVVHPEFVGLPGSTRETFVDLFNVTWENDSRPRRQYAALMSGAGHVDLPNARQLNSYADHVVKVIQLSDQFWRAGSTQRFLEADLAGWFFPGPAVDGLLRALQRVDSRAFPAYTLGDLQSCSDPRGRYEFLQPQRIVLTGSDTEDVRRVLAGIWHTRKHSLEPLPISEVFRLAADPGTDDQLDVVVVGEPTKGEGLELCEKIEKVRQTSGRLFAIIDASPLGRKIDPTPSYLVGIRGVPQLISGDPYDSDILLQQKIMKAQLQISRQRYDRRMRPGAADWESFLPPTGG